MAAMLQNALSGEKISQILNSAGPTVSCVYVPGETGVAVEVTLDMTPKFAAPAKQLGGSPTFAGTITSLDVVIMCLREPAPGTAANAHVLPAPMDTAQIPGPILMIRMDENSEPQHFTLAEYETYKKNTSASSSSSSTSSSSSSADNKVAEESNDNADGSDDEEEQDDDDEAAGDDDDDDEEDYMEHVVKRIAEVFKQQTGRDPTPEEVEALIENMSGEPGNDEEDDDEEVEEEEEEETLEGMTPEEMAKLLRTKLAEAFTQSQGRAPTEEEIDQLLSQMSEDTDFQDELLMAGQQQAPAAISAPAVKTPAPADNKKRTLEGGEEQADPKQAKVSPTGVTETASVDGQ